MSSNSFTQEKPLVVQITTVPQTLYGLFPTVVEHLKATGFEIKAITSEGEEFKYTKAVEKLNIEIAVAPLSRRINPIADLKALYQLIKILRRWKPQIVHCHTPKAGLIGGLAAWFSRIPCRLYTVRGLPHVTATGLTKQLLVNAERIACAVAHRIPVVSHSVHDELLASRICKKCKMAVPGAGSAQGVDAEFRFNPECVAAKGKTSIREQLGIAEDAFVVGFVGRLTTDKGIEQLWKVWKKSKLETSNTHLLVIGPGNEPRGNVADTIKKLQNESNVHLLGRVENIENYLLAMDVFLFPSYREGFSNAVLEASAMALPTIAFDAVGCRDAVQNEITGYIVPFKDDLAMTRRLLQLYEDPQLRTKLGDQARAWVVNDFQPIDRLKMVEAEYRQLLSKQLINA